MTGFLLSLAELVIVTLSLMAFARYVFDEQSEKTPLNRKSHFWVLVAINAVASCVVFPFLGWFFVGWPSYERSPEQIAESIFQMEDAGFTLNQSIALVYGRAWREHVDKCRLGDDRFDWDVAGQRLRCY